MSVCDRQNKDAVKRGIFADLKAFHPRKPDENGVCEIIEIERDEECFYFF